MTLEPVGTYAVSGRSDVRSYGDPTVCLPTVSAVFVAAALTTEDRPSGDVLAAGTVFVRWGGEGSYGRSAAESASYETTSSGKRPVRSSLSCCSLSLRGSCGVVRRLRRVPIRLSNKATEAFSVPISLKTASQP